DKRVARPAGGLEFRLHHAGLDILVADDSGADAGIRELIGEERTRKAGVTARGAKLHVPAGAIGQEACIRDELNRLGTELADRIHHLGRKLTRSRIDYEWPLIAGLHDDVSAVAEQHIHIA